ncbi:hypothetical protein CF319_g3212 [Tilletia indica]|nr:hypothetical protein CF319_g3212 [Tilletia indica]
MMCNPAAPNIHRDFSSQGAMGFGPIEGGAPTNFDEDAIEQISSLTDSQLQAASASLTDSQTSFLASNFGPELRHSAAHNNAAPSLAGHSSPADLTNANIGSAASPLARTASRMYIPGQGANPFGGRSPLSTPVGSSSATAANQFNTGDATQAPSSGTQPPAFQSSSHPAALESRIGWNDRNPQRAPRANAVDNSEYRAAFQDVSSRVNREPTRQARMVAAEQEARAQFQRTLHPSASAESAGSAQTNTPSTSSNAARAGRARGTKRPRASDAQDVVEVDQYDPIHPDGVVGSLERKAGDIEGEYDRVHSAVQKAISNCSEDIYTRWNFSYVEYVIQVVKGQSILNQREHWECRHCGKPYEWWVNARRNHTGHFSKQEKDGGCKRKLHPLDPTLSAYEEGPRSSSSSSAASSRSSSQPSIQDGFTCSVAALRRQLLINIIDKAKPFNHYEADCEHDTIRMISPRHADALVSAKTFKTDLSEYRGELEKRQIELFRQHSTTFSLQFDGWSTRSQKYSFSCLTATWIDSVHYKVHHTVLDMSTIKGRKSASALTGWLIGVLHRLGIFSRWSGHLTTDSESTNIKVHAWLPGRIQQHLDVLPQAPSDLARLPRSSSWSQHPWKWSGQSTLCFAHHIHLIVTAGYEELGANMPGSNTEKVVEGSTTSSSAAAILRTASESVVATAVAAAADAAGDAVNANGHSVGDAAIEAQRAAEDLFRTSSTSAAADVDHSDDVDGDEDAQCQREYEDRIAPLQDQMKHAERRGNPSRRDPSFFDRPEDDPDSELDGNTYSALVRLSGLCAFILNSSSRRDMFSRIKKTVQPDREYTMPIKYVSTRWNSRYDQQRRALLLRPSLDQFILACPDPPTKKKVQQYAITDKEWQGIKQFNEVLAYFAVVNRKFQEQGPDSVLSSDVLEFHCRLKRMLEVKQQQNFDVAVSRALARMADELSFWRKLALASDTLVLAALLDPRPGRRMKGFRVAYPEDVERATNLLIEHAERVGEDSNETGTASNPVSMPLQRSAATTSSTALKVDILDEFRSIPHAARTDESIPNTRRAHVIREVTAYLDESKYPPSEDVLDFWRRSHVNGVLPYLRRLARQVHSVPASTALVERVFSHAGQFCDPQRPLGDHSISDLVVTKFLRRSTQQKPLL